MGRFIDNAWQISTVIESVTNSLYLLILQFLMLRMPFLSTASKNETFDPLIDLELYYTS